MKPKLIVFLAISLLLPLSVYSQREENFLKYAKDYKIIVVAKVVKRYQSPLAWSGIMLFSQNVKYQVITILKGELKSDEIIAGHYLYYRHYMSDEQIPQLSLNLFKVGNKLILLLSNNVSCLGTINSKKPKDRPLYCAEAVIPYSESLAEKIKTLSK